MNSATGYNMGGSTGPITVEGGFTIPVTNQIYIDSSRVDVYAETGTVQKPFQTFAAAISYITGQTPAAANPFVIVCNDAETYTNDLVGTLPAYVHIFAPNATIEISSYNVLTLSGNQNIKLGAISLSVASCDYVNITNANNINIELSAINTSGSFSSIFKIAGTSKNINIKSDKTILSAAIAGYTVSAHTFSGAANINFGSILAENGSGQIIDCAGGIINITYDYADCASLSTLIRLRGDCVATIKGGSAINNNSPQEATLFQIEETAKVNAIINTANMIDGYYAKLLDTAELKIVANELTGSESIAETASVQKLSYNKLDDLQNEVDEKWGVNFEGDYRGTGVSTVNTYTSGKAFAFAFSGNGNDLVGITVEFAQLGGNIVAADNFWLEVWEITLSGTSLLTKELKRELKFTPVIGQQTVYLNDQTNMASAITLEAGKTYLIGLQNRNNDGVVDTNDHFLTKSGFAPGLSTDKNYLSDYINCYRIVAALDGWASLSDGYSRFGIHLLEGALFSNDFKKVEEIQRFIKNITLDGTNSVIGLDSGNQLSATNNNTALGANTLAENSDSDEHTAIGADALKEIKDPGMSNVAIGYQAQTESYGGYRNTSVGVQTLMNLLFAPYNVAIGYQSQMLNILGLRNTSNGYKSLLYNTFGCYNVGVGFKALYLLQGRGALVTNIENLENGNVRFTSVAHGLPNGTTIQIIGTSHYYDKGQYENYDGENIAISNVTSDTFDIEHSYITESLLYGFGAWRVQTEANANTALGYYAGGEIGKGSRNLSLGYLANPADLDGDDQLSIQNAFYGNLLEKWLGSGGITVPKASFHGTDIAQKALSADPADPDTGHSVQWVSDGTGSGDAGDVMIKINVAGTIKTITLIDFSAS